MKAISLTIHGALLPGTLDGTLLRDRFRVKQHVEGTFHDVLATHEMSISGAALHAIDQGPNAGSAVTGALVGGLLAGGVGAVIGAGMGGRRRHVLAVQYPTAVLVAEFDTSEVQRLAALGALVGQRAPGTPSVSVGVGKTQASKFLQIIQVLVVCAVVVGLVRLCAGPPKPTTGGANESAPPAGASNPAPVKMGTKATVKKPGNPRTAATIKTKAEKKPKAKPSTTQK